MTSLPRLLIGADVTLMSRHAAQRLLIGPEIMLVTLSVLMVTIVCHRISVPAIHSMSEEEHHQKGQPM